MERNQLYTGIGAIPYGWKFLRAADFDLSSTAIQCYENRNGNGIEYLMMQVVRAKTNSGF